LPPKLILTGSVNIIQKHKTQSYIIKKMNIITEEARQLLASIIAYVYINMQPYTLQKQTPMKSP
jgi:hypothetical protein